MSSTAEARGDLVEELLPLAAHLACIVRGDGGPEDIAEALDALTPYEQTALIVSLAGLVNPDTHLHEALGYLTWDEHGNETPPVRADHRTIRTLATRYRIRYSNIDMARVIRCLHGEPFALTAPERRAAIEYGARRMDLPFDIIAARLDMELPAVKRSWERIKRRARKSGETWPNQPRFTTEAAVLGKARTA